VIDRVLIGSRYFKVDSFPHGFGERVHGETDFDNLTIRVHDDLPPTNKAITLVHELLHVLWDEYGLAEGDKEERIVTTLSNGLCQVIRDNPEAVAFIIAGVRK
jgi:hypothetical protein